jgi:hypothetical protein
METRYQQYQCRALIGDRHFILADPQRPDLWALPGPVISSEDENGNRRYSPPRTISSARLLDWARSQGHSFHIEEQYPVLRRDISP